MQSGQIPTKIPVAWASGAGASYVRQIPQPSQQNVTPGAASLTDGFPPVCFQPVGSGGIPPFGQDFNGILSIITQWIKWTNAGNAVPYDAAFCAAIGGYPKGAVVVSATFPYLWLSTVENNTSNPDQNGAGWTQVQYFSSSLITATQIFNITGGYGFTGHQEYTTFQPSGPATHTLTASFTASTKGNISATSKLSTTSQPGLSNAIAISVNGTQIAGSADSVAGTITDTANCIVVTGQSVQITSTVTASQALTYNSAQYLDYFFIPS